MARGDFFSPGGSSFSTKKSGDNTQVAGFFSKKKEVPTKKFKGIKGITATKDAINSQTYRDMGDESMADEFKKKYNIDPSDYMNLQSKRFFSPSGNEVGQIASATTDLSGLTDDASYENYMKVQGIKHPRTLSDMFHRLNKMNFRDDVESGRFKDGQFVNMKLPSDYKETESKVNLDNMLKENFGDDADSMDYGTKQMFKEYFQKPDGTFDSPVKYDGGQFLNKRLTDDTKIALGGDNLGSFGGIAGSLGIFGLGLRGIQNAIEGGKRLKENIEKKLNPEGNKVSVGDRVSGFLNNMMGISPVAAGTLDANQQVSQVSERPKLNYVNPDAKTMTMSQIGEAFKPKNLFGYQDKFGRYDDPGSPLDKKRQETMQNVYNRFTRPMTPDDRTIGQIRADQKESMQEAARLRYQDFKDRRALGPAANIQKTFGADDTYGTNVPSNPAMGFRDQMSAVDKARYDKAAKEATAGAQTDPSLGNVITQTYNRVAARFGLPQKNLETVDQRQLKKAQEAYNRPRYQQEAYARKMLGITNDMVRADNMQRIRVNAEARQRAFNLQKALKASEKSARRLGGNIGTGRDGGFGTGTQGKGLPSNPKGFSGYSRKKSSTGTSTSSGRGISKSTSRGQGGGVGSRSKGGTGTGKGTQGRGGRRGGSTGGSGSSSKGGTGTGGTKTSRKASKASRGRTGRGRSQCDIRTKIDITSLTNQNLIKDDLATVAYFVQELREQ
jgi:hypothetical protein